MFTIQNKDRSTLTTSEPVYIAERSGKLFYFHPNKQKEITFNLPKGIYFSENLVKRVAEFKPYPKEDYVLKKHVPLEHAKGYKVREGDNVNKGSIKYATKDILIDKKIREDYSPCFEFVYGHELGHTLFDDERLCDFYAHDRMLDLGYNPTQIQLAKNILFKKNLMRKECLESHFIKKTTRR